jgi:hypothetical protein
LSRPTAGRPAAEHSQQGHAEQGELRRQARRLERELPHKEAALAEHLLGVLAEGGLDPRRQQDGPKNPVPRLEIAKVCFFDLDEMSG